MKERPILFSAPMVRAILAGTKTQTRRVVKPQDAVDATDDGEVIHLHGNRCGGFCEFACGELPCPYGQPGERLWVRETWSHTGIGVWSIADAMNANHGGPIYRATDPAPCPGCWWPSIHMPRRFSRIDLEITEVRVERLQAISDADAEAEGIGHTGYSTEAPIMAYGHLWDAINGAGAWDANPWVWVVGFRRVTT